MWVRAYVTPILIIIEGRFQVFQRFSGSKLVLKSVEYHFAALNYYENGSNRAVDLEAIRNVCRYVSVCVTDPCGCLRTLALLLNVKQTEPECNVHLCVMNVWICGCVDVWMYGCVCILAQMLVCEHLAREFGTQIYVCV